MIKRASVVFVALLLLSTVYGGAAGQSVVMEIEGMICEL